MSDADEKIVSLSQELDTLKSELKSSSEKISLEQKRFGNANENLKDELNTALEKIEIVSSNFLSVFCVFDPKTQTCCPLMCSSKRNWASAIRYRLSSETGNATWR